MLVPVESYEQNMNPPFFFSSSLQYIHVLFKETLIWGYRNFEKPMGDSFILLFPPSVTIKFGRLSKAKKPIFIRK